MPLVTRLEPNAHWSWERTRPRVPGRTSGILEVTKIFNVSVGRRARGDACGPRTSARFGSKWVTEGMSRTRSVSKWPTDKYQMKMTNEGVSFG